MKFLQKKKSTYVCAVDVRRNRAAFQVLLAKYSRVIREFNWVREKDSAKETYRKFEKCTNATNADGVAIDCGQSNVPLRIFIGA